MKNNFSKNFKAHFAILSLVAIVAVIGVVGLMFANQSFNDNSGTLGGRAIMAKQPINLIEKPVDINPVLPVGDNDCGVCCCVDIPVRPNVYTSSGLFVYGSDNDANLLKQCRGLEDSLGNLATSHFMIETSSEDNCRNLCAANYTISSGVYYNLDGLTLTLEEGVFKNPSECPEKPQTPVDEPCPEKECCFFVGPDNQLEDATGNPKCGEGSDDFLIVAYSGDKSCREIAAQYTGSSQVSGLVGTTFVLDECDDCLSCCCEPNNNFYVSNSQRECNSHDGVFVSLDTDETCKDVCGSSLVSHLNTNFYVQDGCEDTSTTTSDKPLTCCYKSYKDAAGPHFSVEAQTTCSTPLDSSFVIVNSYLGTPITNCDLLGDYLEDNCFNTIYPSYMGEVFDLLSSSSC